MTVTKGVLAYRAYHGWRGMYLPHSSYPQCIGPQLWLEIRKYFKRYGANTEALRLFVEEQIKDEVVVSNKTGDALNLDWVYVIRPSNLTMDILFHYKVDKKHWKVKENKGNYHWKKIATVNLTTKWAPSWWKIEQEKTRLCK